ESESAPAGLTVSTRAGNDTTKSANTTAPPAEQPLRRHVPAKTRRLRDKNHLDFVSAQPCLICGRQPCDAHHIRFAQPRALGRKVSDEFTVPLCRIHHRELHRVSDEPKWWAAFKIDPLGAAQWLWQRTNGV